jgi:hypothetical protein
MQNNKVTESLSRALVSGSVAGSAIALTAALLGKQDSGSYAAPLNATSHIFWGDEAAQRNDASLKYTGIGLFLNEISAIFWAAFYERWFGRGADRAHASSSLVRPVIGAAVVTAGAYLTDYYLVPKRFTPGFEKRLSGRSLAAVYGALAIGLVAHDLLAAKSR